MSFSYSYSFCFCWFPLSLLSLCLSVFHLYSCFRSIRGTGLTFTSARVLVSSTCRQSRLAHRSNEPHTVHSVLSRPLYPCSHRMCLIAWAVSRSSHKQYNDMANYGISSCTEEPSGRSEETASHSAPASLPLPFANRSFCCTLLSVVFKLCPNCSLAVCRFPAAAPHVDGSAHLSNDHCPYFRFSLERKNAGHFSDHVVCHVGSLRFDVLTLKTTPP